MNLSEALEIVISRTGHERFRWLCSDDNPDAASREGYRRHVMAIAVGPPPPPPDPVPPQFSGIALGGCCG